MRFPYLLLRESTVDLPFVSLPFRISGAHLSAELTGEQLADMKAYLNLTEMVLSNAELYITWAGKKCYMLTG